MNDVLLFTTICLSFNIFLYLTITLGHSRGYISFDYDSTLFQVIQGIIILVRFLYNFQHDEEEEEEEHID